MNDQDNAPIREDGIPPGSMRACDADRDRVAELLSVAYSEGRLSKDEYDERLERAFAARTYADLDQIVTDLPVPPVPAVPPTTTVTPVARMTVCASMNVPSANVTRRAEPRTSSPTTSRVVSTSAPNFEACRRARSVSCAPDTPSGNPR